MVTQAVTIASTGDAELGYIGTITDVTAPRAAHREARTDHLTGLANRRAFLEHLADHFANPRHNDRTIALAILDVDHFKRVNDTHGHLGGDRVLIEIARRLSECSRAGEMLARIGGEEFALLLPGGRNGEAKHAAERGRTAIEGCDFAGVGRITLSAGVGDADPKLDTPSDLLTRADQALYRAKRAGRNVVCEEPPPGHLRGLTVPETPH